jgi:hypothetical protein
MISVLKLAELHGLVTPKRAGSESGLPFHSTGYRSRIILK